MKKEITIRSLEDIKKVNTIASRYNYDIWLHSKTAMVDAKSILGLLTLNLKDKVNVVVNDNEYTNSLFEELSSFMAE